MKAVDQAPQRPEAEILRHRRSDRLCERLTRQMRARECVGGAERRPVRACISRPSGLHPGPAGDQLAEQLHVVVARAEQALVERLLKRPQRGCHRARGGPLDARVVIRAERAGSARESPGSSRIASSPAGRPSTWSRRSSKAISTRTAVPIWKSAALGSGPPIVPAAISSSTRSSLPGSSARSARTCVSLAPAMPREQACERPVAGSGQSRRGKAQNVAREPAPQRAVVQCGPAEQAPRHRLQLPLSPLLRLFDRRTPVGREQRRVGPRLLQRTRYPQRSLYAPAVELQGRHRAAAKAGGAQLQRVKAGHQVDDLVLDALVLEHQARRLAGMGQRQRVQLGGHCRAPYPASSACRIASHLRRNRGASSRTESGFPPPPPGRCFSKRTEEER